MTFYGIVSFAAMAAVLEAGQLAPGDSQLLATAMQAYNNGQNQQAEPLLRDLVQRYPNEFEIVETLGLIYAERGELQRALPLLEAGCRASPSSPEAAANLGVAYLRLRRIPQAVSTLRRAVSLDPKNNQTQSSYGQALMTARRPRDAVQAFAAAAHADPGNADTLYNWALAEFQAGEVRQASEILERIPKQLRSAQAESLCGDAEEAQGHLDRALDCFQTAAKLDPSEQNLNALCVELLRHWSFDAAIKVYDYALGLYPASARLQAGLGIGLYGSGQYERAARVFSRLLVLYPSEMHAKFLGLSCIALKAESDACDALFSYVKLHAADAVAARLAAAAILEWHDTARYDLARNLLEKAIAQDPRSADGYYRMGVLEQQEAKWSESVAMLKRAASLRPEWSSAHLHLAQAYSHLDLKEEAHREGLLAGHFRQEEDAEMENKREALKTFILNNDSSAAASPAPR